MKVLLINVSLRPESPTLMPPVGLGYIATAIDQAGYELEILDIDVYKYSDDQVEDMIIHKEYDVVVMGCIVTAYKKIKWLTEIIKIHKNVPIIIGNSVADSVPEILLGNSKADVAVVGEGDITDIEVLKVLESNGDLSTVKGIYYKKDGKILSTPKREAIKDLDTLPFVNWALFDIETYLEKSNIQTNEPYPMPYDEIRAMPVSTARGCAFNCTFCYHVFKNDKYRVRSAENILEEVKELKLKYGVNYINFFDELTFYSIKQCEDFVDKMIEMDLGVYWTAPCRADLFKEEHLHIAKKLKIAGCVGLGYSLESANEAILQSMNKKISKDDFIRQTKILQEAGLSTWTSIVIGYPEESEETLTQTFDCCYEANIYPSTGYLIPLPGTPIYEYAKKAGHIQNEEEYLISMGDRQDLRINLTNLDSERIQEIVVENLKRISYKLNLGLDESKLIKTGHYKSKKTDAV